jgi:phospholipid/cholesterol/gamma-HCH transport system substrate-binding protein
MIRSEKLETLVGIFLLLGMGFICGIILLLGEVPDLFKPTYDLTVIFPDASGLLRGSDVDLCGALIGKVTSDPHPLANAQEVAVKFVQPNN